MRENAADAPTGASPAVACSVNARRGGAGTALRLLHQLHPDDADWATWVAWQLEELADPLGRPFRVLIQDWDLVAGTNFVTRMHDGLA
ncbi:toll/interleukin-1 receptor domain-containing protein, partial [Candidatus Frankia alpina]|uniref:toll/interleukin-1 receptor domain-containing protein n=1 Tax=Candidatus Frankia alpina TaxID=2699483 RepID=UPI0019688C8E